MCFGKSETNVNDVWYLYFGCSNHMFVNKKIYSKLNDGFRFNITLSNNNQEDVASKGAKNNKTKESTKIVQDIHFTPKLKHNL